MRQWPAPAPALIILVGTVKQLIGVAQRACWATPMSCLALPANAEARLALVLQQMSSLLLPYYS